MSEQRNRFRRGRQLETRTSTAFWDRAARTVITLGGIGTIVAVCMVFLFLFWVVKDLFLPARVGEPRRMELDGHLSVHAVGIDVYRTIGWTLDASGRLAVFDARAGTPLFERTVVEASGPQLTAFASEPSPGRFALGYADGTVRLGRIEFTTDYREADAFEGELRSLAVGATARVGDSIAERTVRGQFRVQTLVFSLGDPAAFTPGAPVFALQRAARDGGTVVAAVAVDGRVIVRLLQEEPDPFGGEPTLEWADPQPIPSATPRGRPDFVQLANLGTNLMLGWRDGSLERWAIRNLERPRLAESLDLTPERDVELTALGILLGGSTLISGRSDGVVGGWFVAEKSTNDVDGFALVEAHVFDLDDPAPITAITTSTRERIFAVGTASGRVHVMHMTSEKRIADIAVRDREPVQAVAIAERNDMLISVTSHAIAMRSFDPKHAGVSFGTFFRATWYEREPAPTYSWQSSAGSDEFEPKLSLIPLIFGTLKATFYSMLLAVPLALLAAIYTSEFLTARTRSRVKPIVELMASLPSVVLGFLAAIVIAPAIEDLVPELLTALFTVPFVILLCAHVWQVLPTQWTLRHGWLRLPLAFCAMVVGVLVAAGLGPAVERFLFGGPLSVWLYGKSEAAQDGSAGWFVLLLPLCVAASLIVVNNWVNPWLSRRLAGRTQVRIGVAHLGKFLISTAATILVAYVLGRLIFHLPGIVGIGADVHADLRDGVMIGPFDVSPMGAFGQRNSLVVGFVMGFAVIPIIYTIAEDALSSVPEHLRAASLGAGATPWQTAVRVIVPTAMSGLFSACMIGLGRAVGETMIVLMAAGGTALMSMNMFSGFRTLSANIASELPEAVRGSTHYVTLFLCALVLFAVTFVINTIAERVRQRFRRRAYQL